MNGRDELPKLEYFDETGFLIKNPAWQRLEKALQKAPPKPDRRESILEWQNKQDEINRKILTTALYNKYVLALIICMLEADALLDEIELQDQEQLVQHKILHERERLCQPLRDQRVKSNQAIQDNIRELQTYVDKVQLTQFEKNPVYRNAVIAEICVKMDIDENELLQAIQKIPKLVQVKLPVLKPLERVMILPMPRLAVPIQQVKLPYLEKPPAVEYIEAQRPFLFLKPGQSVQSKPSAQERMPLARKVARKPLQLQVKLPSIQDNHPQGFMFFGVNSKNVRAQGNALPRPDLDEMRRPGPVVVKR